MVTEVVKIHFAIYILTNLIKNAIKSDREFYQHRVTGFVRVMENLESHGILEFHFPGLESHGI